jgi:hypothetical protein
MVLILLDFIIISLLKDVTLANGDRGIMEAGSMIIKPRMIPVTILPNKTKLPPQILA